MRQKSLGIIEKSPRERDMLEIFVPRFGDRADIEAIDSGCREGKQNG